MIREVLGREPNSLELALYGVMWSEHCSYKSSRIHLRRLPTEGPTCWSARGRTPASSTRATASRWRFASKVTITVGHRALPGGGDRCRGILRDVFTMGARPLAVMDPLFFGELSDARQRWLVEGVVSGISGYGNSVGVPTIGGELTFDDCYASNPS